MKRLLPSGIKTNSGVACCEAELWSRGFFVIKKNQIPSRLWQHEVSFNQIFTHKNTYFKLLEGHNFFFYTFLRLAKCSKASFSSILIINISSFISSNNLIKNFQNDSERLFRITRYTYVYIKSTCNKLMPEY